LILMGQYIWSISIMYEAYINQILLILMGQYIWSVSIMHEAYINQILLILMGQYIWSISIIYEVYINQILLNLVGVFQICIFQLYWTKSISANIQIGQPPPCFFLRVNSCFETTLRSRSLLYLSCT
jgi:hypothetical protein